MFNYIYLFIFIDQTLNVQIYGEQVNDQIHSINFLRIASQQLTLQYTKDMLFSIYVKEKDVKIIIEILEIFSLALELVINLAKSDLYMINKHNLQPI